MIELDPTYPVFAYYPYNLLLEIFENDAHAAIHAYPDGIDAIMETLSEKARFYLEQRFRQYMSYRQIAKYHGVSTEQARQVVLRAVKAFRHGTNPYLLRALPESEIRQKELVFARLSNEHELLKAAYAQLRNELYEPEPGPSKIDETPIEALGLSPRPYNALKRAKIRTLGALVSKTGNEIWKIRTLGEKSFREITDKLAEIGLTLRPDDGTD